MGRLIKNFSFWAIIALGMLFGLIKLAYGNAYGVGLIALAILLAIGGWKFNNPVDASIEFLEDYE